MQFFSEECLARELTQAKFTVASLHGSLNFDSPLGTSDSKEIGVTAQT